MPVNAPTLLVVEDNGLIRGALVELLRAEGYAPLAAADGEAAIRTLRTHADVALVVLDWQMPGLDGRAFYAWLRAEETFRFLPVLMLTGHDLPPDLCAAPALTCLTKPVDFAALLGAIAALLDP